MPGRKRHKRWPWFLGLILVLGLVPVVIWTRRSTPPPVIKPAPATETGAKMETLSLTEIQEGDKRWVLEAQKADFLKDRMEIRISGVVVQFFEPREEERLRVKCQEGLINTKTRVLTLKGQVELDYQDLHVRTSILTYQPNGRILLAPEDVVLEGSRLRVRGKDLRVDLADKRLTLAHHYSTEIKVQGWEPPL